MGFRFMLYDHSSGEVAAVDPLVSSIPADIAGCYVAVASDESSPKRGLVPDIGLIKRSAETVLDTGVQTTTGVKVTRVYKVPVPADMTIAGRVWLFGKSGALNQTANTGDKARVCFTLRKNGSAIAGVTQARGTERIPNSATEVNYTEILAVDLPKTSFNAGDTLDLVVDLEVTAVDGSNPGIQFKLYCDPATAGNELVFYLQVT